MLAMAYGNVYVARVAMGANDQQTLHGGQLLVKLRTAYSEQVVQEVTRRVRGAAHRTVEGNVVKIRVRY